MGHCKDCRHWQEPDGDGPEPERGRCDQFVGGHHNPLPIARISAPRAAHSDLYTRFDFGCALFDGTGVFERDVPLAGERADLAAAVSLRDLGIEIGELQPGEAPVPFDQLLQIAVLAKNGAFRRPDWPAILASDPGVKQRYGWGVDLVHLAHPEAGVLAAVCRRKLGTLAIKDRSLITCARCYVESVTHPADRTPAPIGADETVPWPGSIVGHLKDGTPVYYGREP